MAMSNDFIGKDFRMMKRLALAAAVLLAVGGTARADIDPIKTRQAGLDLLATTNASVKAGSDRLSRLLSGLVPKPTYADGPVADSPNLIVTSRTAKTTMM